MDSRSPDSVPIRTKPLFDIVSFPPNTAVLTDEGKQKIAAAAEALKDWTADVLVEGFAADVGSEAKQKSLSEERAAVRDYLVSLGVRTAD